LLTTFGEFFHKELPAAIGMGGETPDQIVSQALEGISKASKATGGEKEETGLWPWEIDPMRFIYQGLLTVLIFLLNLLLAVALIFAIYMPIAAFWIGAIFGPLMLSMIAWDKFADLSSRWASFMIANGITFVVAIVILKCLKATIAAMTLRMQEMAVDGSGLAAFILSAITVFAVYIFATNLLLKADNIAQGITGGAAIGEGLFGKIASGAAAVGMGKMAKAAGVGLPAKAITGAAQAPAATGKALGKLSGMAAKLASNKNAAGPSKAGSRLNAASEKMQAASEKIGNSKITNVLSKTDQVLRTPVAGQGRQLASPTPYRSDEAKKKG
jgi:type IV secretory pathway TrbL component